MHAITLHASRNSNCLFIAVCSVLKVFECSCLVFSLALFIPPLAPFLNLIKFSIFMPSGPWTALPLLTSPMSLLVLLLQMLCVPQSRSDMLLGPVSWKGLCACCGTLPVIPLLGRVPQGRCLNVSEAAVLHQTGLFSVVRLPRQLGAST